jgi:glycosyltransferase involved in cell wall biosynthesis
MAGARTDVNVIYRSLDIFALPSLNEGISNTLLEAMASRLPVVATAVGGNVELVHAGRNGALVPAASASALAAAVRTYVDDPVMRVRHGNASRDIAIADFSVDSMVARYLDLYDQATHAHA